MYILDIKIITFNHSIILNESICQIIIIQVRFITNYKSNFPYQNTSFHKFNRPRNNFKSRNSYFVPLNKNYNRGNENVIPKTTHCNCFYSKYPRYYEPSINRSFNNHPQKHVYATINEIQSYTVNRPPVYNKINYFKNTVFNTQSSRNFNYDHTRDNFNSSCQFLNSNMKSTYSQINPEHNQLKYHSKIPRHNENLSKVNNQF